MPSAPPSVGGVDWTKVAVVVGVAAGVGLLTFAGYKAYAASQTGARRLTGGGGGTGSLPGASGGPSGTSSGTGSGVQVTGGGGGGSSAPRPTGGGGGGSGRHASESGLTSSDIGRYQNILRGLGHLPLGPTSGELDDRTRAAIRAFQEGYAIDADRPANSSWRIRRLGVDGVLGPLTRQVLDDHYSQFGG